MVKEDWWLLPISHWKFDEGSGTTAYDSAGVNDGTIYGAAWTTGQINGALNFDGVDDYVDVGDPIDESLDFGASDSFSISAWIRTNMDSPIVYKRRCGGIGGVYYEGYSFILLYKKQVFGIEDTSGRNAGIFGNTVVADDRWHHVVVVRDIGEDKLYLYADGSSDAAPVHDATTGTLATSRSFHIGRRDSTVSPGYLYCEGKIDDVRIYDRALSAEEIREIFRTGMGNKAFAPYPADGATHVDPNVVLTWSPGKDALSHDVYLGTDYNDVNDANTLSDEYKGNYQENSYDPCGLELVTNYYWRIDEVADSNIYKGDVWSFKTYLEPNLISWWKFDEGQGTIAYDSAGSNHGNVYGATWTTGQINGALSFDGVNDYVDVGNDSSLKTTGDLTIHAWIKAQKNRACIYSHSWTGWGLGFGIGNNNYDGRLGFYTQTHGHWIEAGGSLADDTWHQVAATLEGTMVRLYTDGIEIGSDTGTPAANLNGIGLIGLYNYDWFFGGVIDDVKIFNRALPAPEIQQLYNNGSAGL
jgi:hypothetical protein